MAEVIREIAFGKESSISTHEEGSETMSKQRKYWKKGKRVRATRNVARDISAEITRKINTTMFHTKKLKRENRYYSALLKSKHVVKIKWENFPARPPWTDAVNVPASF